MDSGVAAEAAGSAGEIVDIVDDDNRVIGRAARSQMRARHLPHRASYLVCRNGAGRYLVELRTLSKDYAPGKFGACVGGLMRSGEDPELAARRELFEEVGLDPGDGSGRTRMTALGTLRIPYRSGASFLYAYLYLVESDAVTVRQACELSAVMWLDEQEVRQLGDCLKTLAAGSRSVKIG